MDAKGSVKSPSTPSASAASWRKGRPRWRAALGAATKGLRLSLGVLAAVGLLLVVVSPAFA